MIQPKIIRKEKQTDKQKKKKQKQSNKNVSPYKQGNKIKQNGILYKIKYISVKSINFTVVLKITYNNKTLSIR